ncbi:uncharacterized protein LOC123507346 isoform X2 [Portunus trituberculatus]|uniref:uncharacterized protein LOC123507346 isoform X2 n=1 Tax=Portunus trituberculatus TaxID=210409 RepID=UPI001E1CC2B7|nr:uncharacterized protein LOC123507346 isoform X2 [Portunus trituberculatus]
MYSTVHAVFVVDLSKLVSLCSSVNESEHIAKIKLLCLKLLQNFSTKTKRAHEDVQWSWKFYDSHTSRLDTSRRHFLDFEMNAFRKFEAQLTDKYRKASDNKLVLEERERSMYELPHSFLLKQALLEVLLDYTWDSPDISSPVKITTRSDGSVERAPLAASGGTYNMVVVITNVPRSSEASCEASPEVFLANVLDDVKIKAFRKKNISISLIDMLEPVICPLPFRRRTKLAKLGGSLHSITDFIQTQPKCVTKTSSAGIPECGQKGVAVFSKQMQLPWLTSQINQARKPLPGPTLLWDDVDRILHLSTQLQVFAVHGSCSRAWGSAAVVGVVQTNQVSLLALAQETCSLYICVNADEILRSIITVLGIHQLSLVLKLSGGGLAFFSPSEEMTGCLALVSTSGLAALAPDMPDCPPSTLQLVSAAIRECLKNVAPHVEQESVSSSRWFSGSMVQRWFRPLPHAALSALRVRNKLTPHKRALLERLKKRYHSQISLLGATKQTDLLNLMDIFQPRGASQPSQATLTRPTMTQQLFRKSLIVTAQQRVKEQLVEEERRAAKAREHAPEVQVLRIVSDPQEVFYRVMMSGVLLSAADIFNHPQQETHVHQYKLHVLLHLELLFVLGYSVCSKQSEGREEKKEEEGDKRKEHHVEEVIKLLYPSTMVILSW